MLPVQGLEGPKMLDMDVETVLLIDLNRVSVFQQGRGTFGAYLGFQGGCWQRLDDPATNSIVATGVFQLVEH